MADMRCSRPVRLSIGPGPSVVDDCGPLTRDPVAEIQCRNPLTRHEATEIQREHALIQHSSTDLKRSEEHTSELQSR